MDTTPLVLGSSSAFRRDVLSSLGVPFTCLAADIDEKAIRRERPEELVRALAEAKADTILARVAGPMVLVTCDQVCVCEGEVLEKPEGAEQVPGLYARYARAGVRTVSGVQVTDTTTGARASGVDVVDLSIAPVPLEVARSLATDGAVLVSAGALVVEDPRLAPYVTGMSGDLDSVRGLPLSLLGDLLAQIGYRVGRAGLHRT